MCYRPLLSISDGNPDKCKLISALYHNISWSCRFILRKLSVKILVFKPKVTAMHEC